MEDTEQIENTDIHLRDYWEVILKHRWTVATVSMVTAVTVAIFTFSATPVYKATATIKIDKETPKVVNYEDVLPKSADAQDFYRTQYGILKSRAIAKMVIEKLSLDKHQEFQPSVGAIAAGSVDERKLMDSFQKRLEIEPVKNSSLLKVAFSSSNPEFSSQAANAVAQAYIDYNVDSKFRTSEKARQWLLDKINEVRARVEVSEEALQTYTRERGIFSLEKDENIVMQRLENLNMELSKAETDRMSKEAIYSESAGSPAEALLTIRGNQLIGGLKAEHAKLESEYSRLMMFYKPDYPKMTQLKNQMDTLEERIRKEVSNLVDGIASDYREAMKREQFIRSTFETQRELAIQMKDKAIQYNILKREVDTNKELYNGLLQRLKEIGTSAVEAISNVQVLDRAEVPDRPFKPSKGLNIILGVWAGLFLGICSAFSIEYMDDSIKEPGDVEKFLHVPILGLIPSLEGKGELYPELISLKNIKSPLSEAFRTLRTSLIFSSPGSPPKIILATSSKESEGKSTVASNLGTVIAQGGGRVLIIDADLRRPSVHKVFSSPISPGLTNLLTGNAEEKSVIKSTEVPGLFIIPSGPIPPNPVELLGSQKMKEVIAGLKNDFDFIILDTPPINGLADTLTLTQLVDGVIMVVHGGITPKWIIRESIKQLKGTNTPILGVVINNLQLKKNPYSHYYASYDYSIEKSEKKSRSRWLGL
ncbi:MAG: putative Protein-tyrosine kinase [Deltaproteobacteria bacterium]|nr:putative Protein-tyrosine kinase [Deltaproteobacteria bacterium]